MKQEEFQNKISVLRPLRNILVIAAMTFPSFLCGLRAQSGPTVWVASSLVRVGPTDSPGSGLTAQLYAARGEYESFQIIVRAPSGGLSNVDVTVSDLVGPGGGIIPKEAFTLYREHYVYVSQSSPNWGGSNQPKGPGWYPDGLIPFNDPTTGAPLSGAVLDAVPFNLAAGKNQPIWIDLRVPQTAVAGQYYGTYTMSSNQGTATGQITVKVWNFTLPLKPSLRSSFLFWTSGSQSAYQEMLRNKLEPIREDPSLQPDLINNYGLGDVGLPFWSGADIGTCSMSSAPSVSQFQTSASSQQSVLYKYVYSADEIGNCTNLYTTIKQWAYNMHQAGVDNLITMSPTPSLFDDGSGTGRSAVDIWVMLPVMYNNSTSYVAQALAKGDEAWSYNTLVQDSYSPKWEIDFDPINFRIHPGFINQSLGLTGLLYWRVDLWSSDPWNNVSAYGSGNYPGEGVLVYPGTQVGVQGVAPSMRLKWLRDGVEDYEYIAILKGLGQGPWALQVAASIGASWSNWTRDSNQLQYARQQLGAQIDQLTSGSTTTSTPSAPANPSPANGATGVSVAPTLSWSASANATSYNVYFGTSASPPLVGTTAGTTYTPSTLSNSTTYYWIVVATNSSVTASSATWSFTTAASPTPAAPTNPSPANGATGVSVTPTLSWSASENATSYNVYFGSSATPPLVGTTSGTTYTPGTLSNSTTYYWIVVATDSSGTASSATWSFTTAASSSTGAPQAISVSPSSGTGFSATFQFLYSDPNGASHLSGAGVLISTSLDSNNSCWFYYNQTNNTLWLANNNSSSWTSAPKSSGKALQNGQCSIVPKKVRVSQSGNNLTLTVPVTFKSGFAGTRTLYLYANDLNGLSSGYQARGTWTIP